MFCSKCGCKLNNEALFCHNCGEKVSINKNLENSIEKESREIELNRTALKIYLYDILTLECIKNKYNAMLYKIKKQFSLTGNYFEKKYVFLGKDSWRGSKTGFYFLHKQGKNYIYADYAVTCKPYVVTELWDIIMPYRDWDSYISECEYRENSTFLDIEQNYKDLSALAMWTEWDVIMETGFFKKREKAKKARAAFFKSYEDFKKIAEFELNNVNENRKLLQSNYAGIYKELESVNKMLKKEYGLNIIPSNFRNITAIYYLYNFITTSNQSFTTALMHFDLQEIKNKLDKVIQQNREIIIQQAYLISQNERIIAQNQDCLSKLSSLQETADNIVYNTAQAATYSSIAANNAEICAWLGVANYLKN